MKDNQNNQKSENIWEDRRNYVKSLKKKHQEDSHQCKECGCDITKSQADYNRLCDQCFSEILDMFGD